MLNFIVSLIKMWCMITMIVTLTILIERYQTVKKTIQKKDEIIKTIFNSLSIHAIGEEHNHAGVWFMYSYNNDSLEKQFNATFCVKCGNYVKEYSTIHNSTIECKCRDNIENIKNKWKTNITLKLSNRSAIIQ